MSTEYNEIGEMGNLLKSSVMAGLEVLTSEPPSIQTDVRILINSLRY